MPWPPGAPLATQAVTALRELQPSTGSGRYVFPSIRSLRDPMSENTVTATLRRMGCTGDEMTGRGFRSKMTQAWADYLDVLRTSGNVVPIKRKTSVA